MSAEAGPQAQGPDFPGTPSERSEGSPGRTRASGSRSGGARLRADRREEAPRGAPLAGRPQGGGGPERPGESGPGADQAGPERWGGTKRRAESDSGVVSVDVDVDVDVDVQPVKGPLTRY